MDCEFPVEIFTSTVLCPTFTLSPFVSHLGDMLELFTSPSGLLLVLKFQICSSLDLFNPPCITPGGGQMAPMRFVALPYISTRAQRWAFCNILTAFMRNSRKKILIKNSLCEFGKQYMNLVWFVAMLVTFKLERTLRFEILTKEECNHKISSKRYIFGFYFI